MTKNPAYRRYQLSGCVQIIGSVPPPYIKRKKFHTSTFGWRGFIFSSFFLFSNISFLVNNLFWLERLRDVQQQKNKKNIFFRPQFRNLRGLQMNRHTDRQTHRHSDLQTELAHSAGIDHFSPGHVWTRQFDLQTQTLIQTKLQTQKTNYKLILTKVLPIFQFSF